MPATVGSIRTRVTGYAQLARESWAESDRINAEDYVYGVYDLLTNNRDQASSSDEARARLLDVAVAFDNADEVRTSKERQTAFKGVLRLLETIAADLYRD